MNSAAGFDIYGSSILQFNLINSSRNANQSGMNFWTKIIFKPLSDFHSISRIPPTIRCNHRHVGCLFSFCMCAIILQEIQETAKAGKVDGEKE